jgi:hypothetical protein
LPSNHGRLRPQGGKDLEEVIEMFEIRRWSDISFEDQVPEFVNKVIHALDNLISLFDRNQLGPRPLRPGNPSIPNRDKVPLWVSQTGVLVYEFYNFDHPDTATNIYPAKPEELGQLLRDCTVGLEDVQLLENGIEAVQLLRQIQDVNKGRKLFRGHITISNCVWGDVLLTQGGIVFGAGQRQPLYEHDTTDWQLSQVMSYGVQYRLDKVREVMERLEA